MFDQPTTDALRKLLLFMADDNLIIGHRNSEWTGLGPILEEDIAFSSIAQDKIGHALGLYSILHEQLGEADPDMLAFMRNETDFTSCQLVELPIGEYDFSLTRHLFFDLASLIRFEDLAQSAYDPLAKFARKVKGEIKYHVFHANTFMKQLGHGNEESKARMQSAINQHFDLALGMFESFEGEALLVDNGIYKGESALKQAWLGEVQAVLTEAGLKMPDADNTVPKEGGRKGFHTEYLQPLLDEMTEVFRVDPAAEW
ncbi:MAG: 1,2-phenylacetyl-CoA epoxidase subunit PaaC [Bacteroidia bacterium]